MKKIVISLFIVMFVISLVSGVGRAAPVEKRPKAAIIGALAASGSTVHVAAVALSGILTKHTGIKVTVEPGDALLRRAPTFKQGEYALLIGNAFDSYAGFYGKAPFKERVPVRLVMMGHEGYIVAATTSNSGIKKIPDIRGKTVAFDYTDAPFLNVARQYLFEAYGMTANDYRTIKGATLVEANQTLIERRSDAIVNVFSSPMMEVDRAVGLYLIPIGAKELDYVHEKVPVYSAATVRAGTFGYKVATPTIGYNTSLYCLPSLSDDLVYLFVSALLDHYDEMAKVHPLLVQWTLENAVRNSAIPFHNGAIKYYKEKGVWNERLEKSQKELLSSLPETK